MPTMTVHTLAVIFGILGNIVSVGVFLSPLPTFYRIYKRKSSEGYKSLPYAVALFSAMMLLYYGSLKPDGFLLITINSFGCFIEVIYLVTFLVYAPKQTKNFTLKLIVLFNLGVCSLVMLLTTFLAKGSKRITIVGWINAAINLAVFAAPMSVMRQVIRTRSVEFMPISLSLALTLNATMWFFYGFFLKDYFIAGPNILGFFLGMIQTSLYIVYKYCIKRTEHDCIHEDTNRVTKLDPVDDVVKDNQPIEMQIV
ncbi:bidirectional sugar transporter NEC1-like [Chenopodium quinoa]|uniref:bidirectional sugar transporter NEC1-like n=1 Tax=Chenopodium quinoa TaxID=63459 RepID=UPI000B792D89|nr:bidirectional sugar transporter NEC1-like [Chenopodium quinoa]